MSNPFIQSIQPDYSIRRGPLPQLNTTNNTTTNTTNSSLTNYPMAATAFNSDSTYFSGNSGVTSLNALQNAVTISSTNGNLTIAEVGNDIQLTVLAGGIGVESLESLVGNIGLTSTGGSVAITTSGNDINLEATQNVGVTSLESLSGAIGLTSTGGSVAITTSGNDINLEATQNVGVVSLESLTGAIGLTSTGSTVVITTVGNDINLETVGTTPVTDWSLYPAISDVNMANHNITAGDQMGIIVDAGASPSIAIVDIIAQNGTGGRINMTANGGVGGTTYGSIDITANGGTTAGLTSGGSINIISNTPVGTSGSITGKVNINAAGINSYAGAIPTLGSLAGYNFVHGDLAVNVTAGVPPIVPSDPLCVYLYGTNGTLMYGTQYMGRIRPYSDLTINPTDLTIEKYNNGITTGYIVIDGCKTLNMEATASLSVSNGTGSNGDVLGKSGGNLAWVTPASQPQIYQATYYKTTNQNLNDPNTDITFDGFASWNNDGGYITHPSGSTAFTVVQTGLYQLEWNASVTANGATWNTGNNKVISIDITRSPVAEQIVLSQTAVCSTTQNYTQSLSATFYLVAGDVLNCRIQGTFATATPFATALTNTFDLNTWFSWRYISSGGASAYQNPPPVIQTATTTALVPTSANTTYILTSGATQNFTTAGLGTGNAGLVWYVKNASGSDITIQANGSPITGGTSTAHTRTGSMNSSIQIIYWNGTSLIMY